MEEKIIVYQIYNYLKENAVGYDNRKKANEIMKIFGINDNKTFRSHISEIRNNYDLEKIVCSEAGSNGGYWIATNKQEVCDTLEHLYKRAMEMLKTYAQIKRKYALNNQLKFKFKKTEKMIFKSIMEQIK